MNHRAVMWSVGLLAGLSLLAVALLVSGSDDPPPTIVFREDFDTLDTSRWVPEFSTFGQGNDELQCYSPDNVAVADGALVLRALRASLECNDGSVRDYTSGMVRSRGITFAPGQTIEFRVKLTPADSANQSGLWPAVWASGWGGGDWPLGGEMDWLEVMTADDPQRSVFSIHFADSFGKPSKQVGEMIGDEAFSNNWHTVRFDYGIGGNLRWYLDGDLVHTVTAAPTRQGWPAPFDQPISELRINLALGGTPGPLDDAALGLEGATFEVDYVEITQP